MQCGADKISLNTFAIQNPSIISEAARIFGDQCVIVCIDAIKQRDEYKLYEHSTKSILNTLAGEWANKCQDLGAGEILIQSVDRDGRYSGFDIEMIRSICERVNIPVICSGGARTAADFIQVFEETDVSAACASNMFHFTEHSVNLTKSIISKQIPVRLDTHANYLENAVDSDYRVIKKPEDILEKMLYTRIEKEII
jgi:cyclase